MNIAQARAALDTAYPHPEYEVGITHEIDRKARDGKWHDEFTIAVYQVAGRDSQPIFHKWGPSLSQLVSAAQTAVADTKALAGAVAADVADTHAESNP